MNCLCTQRPCGDAPTARSVSYTWDHRARTGEVLAEPPAVSFFAPDLRTAAVGVEDPEGDGTQTLAELNVDLARGDVNGDGLIDQEHSLGTGGPGGWLTPGQGAPAGRNIRPMDYDGDGDTDFLVVAPDGGDPRMVVHRWTNVGYEVVPIEVNAGHFANPPKVISQQYKCETSGGVRGAFVDDIPACSIYPDRTYCLRRPSGLRPVVADVIVDESGRTVPMNTLVWSCELTGALRVERDPGREYRVSQVLDWNGDGLMDIVTVDRDKRLVVHARRGKKADVLTAVEDGYQSRTDVEYAAIADPQVSDVDGSRVYTAASLGCQYPLRCLKSGAWVVRKVTRDTGTAVPADFIHSYADGRIDLRGRRSLGFRYHRMSRKVDLPTPERPSRVTRFIETAVSEKEEAFTEDRGTFPLAGVVTSLRTSVTAPGLAAGTWKTITPELIRGVGGTDPGSPPASRYSIGNGVNVIDDGMNAQIYFVHSLRVTDREFEAESDVFAETSEKRRTITEIWRDRYGNVTRQQTSLAASPGRGRPVPDENLHHREVRHFFDGDDRAPGASFDEARFLRFPRRTTMVESLKATPAPVRTVAYDCDLERATIETVTTEPEGSPDERLATTTAVTEHGLPQTVSAAAGEIRRVSRTVYDGVEFLYPTKTTNSAGHDMRAVFVPGLDRVAWTRDANGRVTRMRYDGFGRIRVVDGPLDADTFTSYALSEAGLPRVVVTSAAGARSVTDIDRLGREVRTERKGFDGNPVEERIEHDPLGRIRSQVKPYGESTFAYDEIGRLTHELRRDPLLAADHPPREWQEIKYEDHFKTTTFDAGRRESYVITDGLGQIVEKGEKLPDRTVNTFYEYKPFGLLWKVRHGTDEARSTTEADYDVLGRRTRLTTPEAGTETRSYNAFGDVREETDAEQRITTFVPDALGRVIEERTEEAGAPAITRYRFDDAPNGIGAIAGATRVTPDAVTTAFAYDPVFGAPRATHLHLPAGGARSELFATEQTYDRFGRPDVVTYPRTGAVGSPLRVQQVYGGADGTLSEVRNVTGGLSAPFWRVDERERLGRVARETLGNGATSTRTYQETTGRLESIRTEGTSRIQDLSYRYYFDGNLALRGDGSGRFEQFAYDHLNRLSVWRESTAQGFPAPGGWSVEWGYDDRGNIESRTVKNGTTAAQEVSHTYGGGAAAPHRLDESSLWRGQRFSYDRLGNITAHPGVGAIAYTSFNLPRRVTNGTSTEYLYDAFGARVQKRSTPVGVTGDAVTYVSGLYERRTSGSEIMHVMYIHADDRVIAQVTRLEPAGNEETSYIHSDRLGSTHVVESANGTLEHRYQDPFGNPLALADSSLDPRLSAGPPGAATASAVTRGFTGHEEEPDLGLVNMVGRTYDPRLGRFLQPDPVVQAPYFSQNYNRYAYVFNNPIAFTDPTGFEAWRNPATGELIEYETIKVEYPRGWSGDLAMACIFAGVTCTNLRDMKAGFEYAEDRTPALPPDDFRSSGDSDGFAGALLGELTNFKNWVPFSSAPDAIRDFRNGNWWGGIINTGLVILDAATLGSATAATGLAKSVTKSILKAEARNAAAKAAVNATKGGLAEARAARDALAAELAPLRSKAPATVTGGYNTRTGEVAARACGGRKCAETHVVEALGGNKAEVSLTEAVRPRTGLEVPVCLTCEATYGRGAFPPGTRFKSD